MRTRECWLFINGRIAFDYGGLKRTRTVSRNWNQRVAESRFGLKKGETYNIDIFFTNRMGKAGSFTFEHSFGFSAEYVYRHPVFVAPVITTICNTGLYYAKDLRLCQLCDKKCATCNGPTENDCLKTVTDVKCPARFFFDFDKLKCKECHFLCKVCTGPTRKECTEEVEDEDYFVNDEEDKEEWKEDGSKICPYGTFAKEKLCYPCHWSCKVCNGPYTFDCVKDAKLENKRDCVRFRMDIRDFEPTHPDMDKKELQNERNIIFKKLGRDRKPRYNYKKKKSATTSGEKAFESWFNDRSRINSDHDKVIKMCSVNDIFYMGSKNFYPMDKVNGKDKHLFTMETHLYFRYRKNRSFSVSNTDDSWVFINNRLVSDLGGIHQRQTRTFRLDGVNKKRNLKLVEGRDYNIDIFFADRKAGRSSFLFKTDLDLLQRIRYPVCHRNCRHCKAPGEFSCTRCKERQHRMLNRNTGECICKSGYKENAKTGKCDPFSFAFVNYDAWSLKKVHCFDGCTQEVRKMKSRSYSLRITVKNNTIPALLRNEDFDRPAICGQYKALPGNKYRYVSGPRCHVQLKVVNS